MIFYNLKILILSSLILITISLGVSLGTDTALAQETGAGLTQTPLPSTPTSEQIQKGKEILKQQTPSEKASAEKLYLEKIQEKGEEKSSKEPAPLTPEKGPSTFEAYIQGKTPTTISMDIKQFGYDLFNQPPSTFAPVDNIPVGSDYILGPGDEIRISVWGKVNAEYSTLVDTEGKINLLQMGILHISGLTFQEARDSIEKEFSRYYKPQEVKTNISTGRLRSIRVFVVGKAQRPGSYTLSSLSTLINALFAVGGPSKNGTMRDIQLKKNSGAVVHFDLYDFLLKGDKTKDIRLLPEDVIFIPPVGSLVGIIGNVNTPAIYELKGEKTLRELLELAGGLNEIAFKGRLQIERIIDNKYSTLFDISIEDIKTFDIKVQPGDIFKIFPVFQGKGVVRLAGAVQREGEYGAGTGITVKELISMAGGLMHYAFTDEAEITRIKVTQQGPETTKLYINLKKALEDDLQHNIRLQENDYVFVKSVPEWALYRTVTIQGEVKFPGVFTIEKGEILSSLIKRAGGFTDKAYLKGAVFTRESVKELQQRQIDESIDRLEQQILSQSARTIETALTPEEAGQQRVAAEQRKALIAKMRAAKTKGRISIKLDDLDKLAGSSSDIILEGSDTLIAPQRSQEIQVMGAVYNQSVFVYEPGETVSSYIEKAGGMTRDSDKDAMYVLKVDGTAISKRVSGSFRSHWTRLDPGDTIVIPEKTEKIAWLREIKDITQILYQIAVTAGVLIVAF